jgi:hypothetical protein
MKPEAPIVDVLIGCEPDTWRRLYLAAFMEAGPGRQLASMNGEPVARQMPICS